MPNEQIGYMATDEYTSRLATPQSASYHKKAHSTHSQPALESPLRKTSFPMDQSIKSEIGKGKSAQYSSHSAADNALESETEEEGVHVEPPTERRSKITGNGYDPPTEDLGPHGGNTEAAGGWIQETGYGVPILASDEVAKEPGSEYMQPAISPAQSRRGSQYYAGVDADVSPSYQSGFKVGSRAGSAANSRPTSRPGSMHGAPSGLHRLVSHDDHEGLHTPLADVDEYEPLFPDEEDKDGKALSAAERFKRKEMMKRFPSQDIWEDTPNSLQLHTTVETPEPKEAPTAAPRKPASSTFETSEQEAARKGEVSESDKAKLTPREERLAKSLFKPHLKEEMQRPSTKQRFPSRDIWEDSPDSARLETEIVDPPHDNAKTPVDLGLTAGAVVVTSGRPDSETLAGKQERENATAGTSAVPKPSIPPRPAKTKTTAQGLDSGSTPAPSIPARPPKRAQLAAEHHNEISSPKTDDETSIETRKGPALPDRSKPEIPKRPENPVAKDISEKPTDLPDAASVSLSDVQRETSGDSVRSPPPAPKPKPAIPARPQGSKIAALKAGFLSDLDKRLQLGPQAPPKPSEPGHTDDKQAEEETAPLSDSRKGRARGPTRRKPMAGPAGTSTPDAGRGNVKWAVAIPRTIWEMEPTGNLKVLSSSIVEEESVSKEEVAESQVEGLQFPVQTKAADDVERDDVAGPGLSKTTSSVSDASAGPVPATESPVVQEAELNPPFQPSIPETSGFSSRSEAPKVQIQSHEEVQPEPSDEMTPSLDQSTSNTSAPTG